MLDTPWLIRQSSKSSKRSPSPEFLPEMIPTDDTLLFLRAGDSSFNSKFTLSEFLSEINPADDDTLLSSLRGPSNSPYPEFLPEIIPNLDSPAELSFSDISSPSSSVSSLSSDRGRRESIDDEEIFPMVLGDGDYSSEDDEEDPYTGKPRGNGRFKSPALVRMEEERRGRSRQRRPLLSFKPVVAGR
jgi:hypothetical protein